MRRTWEAEANESVCAAVLYHFMFAGCFNIPEILGGALEELKCPKSPLKQAGAGLRESNCAAPALASRGYLRKALRPQGPEPQECMFLGLGGQIKVSAGRCSL